MNAKVFSQSYSELQSINTGHPLPYVDVVRALTADLGPAIEPGTLMKRATDNQASAGVHQTVIDGGAAGNHTVTGILATDELISVIHVEGDGTQLTGAADLTDEFSISADDEIDNTGGTATTNGVLIVTYNRPRAVSGDYEPWIQGTDDVAEIAGVFASPQAVDTDTDEAGLIRVFGPVRKDKLVSWTAANGSTTADPSDAALAQLEAMGIYAM